MKELQELLQDEKLCVRIEEAGDAGAITELLNSAGAERGFSFKQDWVADLLIDVKAARGPAAPTMEELRTLASTYMMPADTPPKLCHTESCGGNHAGCC
jgi:hypothetical protein